MTYGWIGGVGFFGAEQQKILKKNYNTNSRKKSQKNGKKNANTYLDILGGLTLTCQSSTYEK